ncbi:Mce protein [Mycolicibacterium thermoresistibile]
MADPTSDRDDTRDPEVPEATAAEPASADDEATVVESTAPADGQADTEAAEAEAEAEAGAEPDGETSAPARRRLTPTRLAGIIGLVLVLALGGAVGWLGYRTYELQQDADLRAQFLEAGRQGAFSLTNVNWEQADADVQRILDAATGSFYDDMQRRAPSYTELVKQAQSVSVGTVTEVGLESFSGNQGTVLASVVIESSNVGVPEQQAQAWRMRLIVDKADDGAKVSAVEFVQ